MHQGVRGDVQNGLLLPSQPCRAETRLSTYKAAELLARGAYRQYVNPTKA